MDNSCLTFTLLLACLGYLPSLHAKPVSGRLLLVMLDGFRFDYLNQTNFSLPGFDKMARLGSKAGGLVSEFPTQSYPNYYSIMTGMHTESHGMTHNYMYDVTRNESFLIGGNPEQANPHWWNDGDPLWVTAVRQKKKVHMYNWPGCEVEIRGLRPTHCTNYSGNATFEDFHDAINQSLKLFTTGAADVCAIYFEQVDSTGHKMGPFSPELNEVIRDLDPIMGDLVDRLQGDGLSDVNLLVFSDHGMTETGNDSVVNISTALDPSEYITIQGAAAIASIYTRPDKLQQVYDKLRHFHPNMTVYPQSDLPESWHYKHGRYVAPLTAVADLGWYIITNISQVNVRPGAHGYDPKHTDMLGIFLAVGPAFKVNSSVERLHNIDLYGAMCGILDITPPQQRHTLANILPILTTSDTASASSLVSVTRTLMMTFLWMTSLIM